MSFSTYSLGKGAFMQFRKTAETVSRRHRQIPPGKRTHKVLAAFIATGFAGAAFLATPSLALATDDELLPPEEHTEEVVEQDLDERHKDRK